MNDSQFSLEVYQFWNWIIIKDSKDLVHGYLPKNHFVVLPEELKMHVLSLYDSNVNQPINDDRWSLILNLANEYYESNKWLNKFNINCDLDDTDIDYILNDKELNNVDKET